MVHGRAPDHGDVSALYRRSPGWCITLGGNCAAVPVRLVSTGPARRCAALTERPDAVVFDVDGTLADTERDGHRPAFNEAFAAAGLPYRWDGDDYGALLAITGGKRRIEHYLRDQGVPGQQADELATTLHASKTERFIASVRAGSVPARPGLAELLDELRAAGVRLAVATTGTAGWVRELLDGLFGPDVFELVLTGDDVPALKPDPAVYQQALLQLELPAQRVVAVEDSANGVRAAVDAGLRCAVVTNDYTRDQDFSGATVVCDGFSRDSRRPLTAQLLLES
ncbi:MAG: HAD-IA family hydrolase [Pseudonocardiaceae bacterium]|nr:HAD-IA family hydrolase [Pseudonocardiaceae bacterium]